VLPFNATHTVALDRDANNTSCTGEGTVEGAYNPVTRELMGTYQVTITSESSLDVKGRKPYHTQITTEYIGKISATIQPGDTSAKVKCNGKKDQRASGTMPNGDPFEEDMTFVSNCGFGVTFAIKGEIPVTGVKPSCAMDDSGVEFIDLAPNAEVLISFLSQDGEEYIDPRNWKKAAPGMTLPVMTMIRIPSDHHQTLLLPDGTTMGLQPGKYSLNLERTGTSSSKDV